MQDYIYTNSIEDIDTLANHYEIDDVYDLTINSFKNGIDSCQVTGDFKISVILYLDHEDDDGFTMSFPAKFQATFDTLDDEFKLDPETVGISVNTDKFYE